MIGKPDKVLIPTIIEWYKITLLGRPISWVGKNFDIFHGYEYEGKVYQEPKVKNQKFGENMNQQELFNLGNIVVAIRQKLSKLEDSGIFFSFYHEPLKDILELINNIRIAAYEEDLNDQKSLVSKSTNCYVKLKNEILQKNELIQKLEYEQNFYKTRIQELNSKINEKDQFISKLQNTIDFLNTKLRDINLFVPIEPCQQERIKKLEYEVDLYKKKYVKCSNLLNSGRLIFTADFSKADLEQFNNDLAETK